MYWRLSPKEYSPPGRGERNRQLLKALVDAGRVPGVLGYISGEPVGWCAIGPREEYVRLRTSPYYARALAPVDHEPVWSVVCFFVKRPYRGQGYSLPLLKAAVAFARSQGARIIEAYPLDKGSTACVPSYTGAVSTFKKLGFVEVARRYAHRPILRLYLHPGPSGHPASQP